ncbi:MAG: hypothetical protein FWG82_02075 [Oscillospiraceae bacterium]|nr:hypothetical protein [Oscillospiraceae bacterium]
MKKLKKIIKLLTFPGAYMKAFWDRAVAKLLKLSFAKNGYVTRYIDHTSKEEALDFGAPRAPVSVWRMLLYCLLPSFICFVIGAPMFLLGFTFLGLFGALPVGGIGISQFVFGLMTLYLGMSMICNVSCSLEDAKTLWRLVRERKSSAALIFLYPWSLCTIAESYFENYGGSFVLFFGGIAIYFADYLFSVV